MSGKRSIVGASVAIAVVMTASAIARGNKVHSLKLEIETLEQKLENVESANNVLVDELTKLIGGR